LTNSFHKNFNTPNKGVLCFGEVLLRMSPQLNGQWINEARMPVYIGGAELNVASALAKWQIPVKYCSALPDNYLSKEIVEHIAARQVDTSTILLSGDRIGVYYLPQGADLKNAGVIYDRSHSSFAELKTGMIDWDEVLKDISWFHFSAINPALNKNIAEVCMEALEAASQKEITISIDLNYRSKLWQYGKKPVEIMPGLLKYCDIVMGNIWAAYELLGISVDSDIHSKKSKENYLAHAKRTTRAIMDQYPRCIYVANTFRFNENEGICYYATLDSISGHFSSSEFKVENVVDKVGSGDCFMAGLIYGFYNKLEPATIINYAAAAAIGKLQETGDATNQTIEQVKSLIEWTGEQTLLNK
jgi:2-dehydro-3-deoxygluconokinase